MRRGQDESGVSGIGTVLYGCIFPDRRVIIQWVPVPRSVAIYDSFDDFLDIHVRSHPTNQTLLVFSDGEELRL